MRITLAEIARVTEGRLDPEASGGLPVDSFTADSREMQEGALFVAVRGERDGHDFLAHAAENGAAAALVDTPVVTPLPTVVVNDTVRALGPLASFARDQLADVPVVAITGSTGKTSTKDLAAAALASKYEVVASPNSFNNELGVPLTLLSTGPTTGAVVAEIGARGRGQVAAMATLVRPGIGVVTTIGAAHTELFGSIDEVAVAKAELLEALNREGMAVVGLGHPFVAFLCSRSPAPVLTVGPEADADVRFSDLVTDAELRPRFVLETPWGRGSVQLEMRGAHQALNAGMAVAAAVSAGVSLEGAIAGMADATGSRWRMEVLRSPDGLTVLNDAYNANPASMAAALEALRSLPVEGRRIAVLGEMAELGEAGPQEHRAVGNACASLGIDRLLAVGRGVDDMAAAARDGGCAVEQVASPEAAVETLRGELRAGDAVLVKASRVVGLERVSAALVGGTAS